MTAETGGTETGGTETGGTGTGSTDRVEQFREAMAKLGLAESAVRNEARMLKLGSGLLATGVGVGVVAFLISHFTTNPLQQRDALVVAAIGISVTLAGAALYLRHSLTRFFRFWLARLVFEQQRAEHDGA